MRARLEWDDEAGTVRAGGTVAWSVRLAWCCRGTPLALRVIAEEPVPLPGEDPGLPVETALAGVLAATVGRGALVALLDPVAAFGRERIAFAAGCRLVGIADEPALACWDALLALGQPSYGLRGAVVVEMARAVPSALIAALAYGAFICEEGLSATTLCEDRAGVELEVDRPADFSVLARGGFPVQASRGTCLSWRDRGGEGVVRIEAVADDGGRLWTQPRLVAPRREAGHA